MNPKYWVCIIATDANMVNTLKGLFKSSGLTLVSYTNLKDLLQAIDEEKPIGCLIGELRDAHRLLGGLAADHCVVPLVLIAGNSGVADAVKAMNAGAFDVVEKPEAAVESAQSALEHYAKHKKLFAERCLATERIE